MTRATHWLTTYDSLSGEPIGSVCWCAIGADHDGDGELSNADEMEPDPEPEP